MSTSAHGEADAFDGANRSPWEPLRETLDDLLKRSDWTISPWFLEANQAPAFEPWGLNRGDLEDAAKGLAVLYPPDYCRRTFEQAASALARPNGRRLSGGPSDSDTDTKAARKLFEFVHVVLDLYQPLALLPPVEKLTRGIDAILVRPAETDPELISRLRHPDQVAGADRELEVWGSLLRAGRRVSRFTSTKRTDRTPDLLVDGFDGQVLLEIKDLGSPEDEISVQTHDNWALGALFDAVTDLPDKLHVEVWLADSIADMNLHQEQRKNLATALDKAVLRLVHRLEQLGKAGWPKGQVEVPGAGLVRVRHRQRADGGPISASLLNRQDADFHASRMLNPIMKAASKGRRSIPTVAFVDVPSNLNHGLAAAFVEKKIAEVPAKFASLDGFIIRSSQVVLEPSPHTTWISWTRRLAASRVTEAQLQRLCDDIIRCTRRQPAQRC